MRCTEKEEMLKHKDTDLRENTQLLKPMHKDHHEQMQFERQRVNKLESELEVARAIGEDIRKGSQKLAEKLEGVRLEQLLSYGNMENELKAER